MAGSAMTPDTWVTLVLPLALMPYWAWRAVKDQARRIREQGEQRVGGASSGTRLELEQPLDE